MAIACVAGAAIATAAIAAEDYNDGEVRDNAGLQILGSTVISGISVLPAVWAGSLTLAAGAGLAGLIKLYATRVAADILAGVGMRTAVGLVQEHLTPEQRIKQIYSPTAMAWDGIFATGFEVARTFLRFGTLSPTPEVVALQDASSLSKLKIK